jgi:hypothetical protein
MTSKTDAERTRVKLRRHLEAHEAQLLLDVLKEQNISAFVHGLNYTTRELALPSAELWVFEDDAERARSVLGELERSETSDGPPVVCQACGQESPPNFGKCWSCGASLGE